MKRVLPLILLMLTCTLWLIGQHETHLDDIVQAVARQSFQSKLAATDRDRNQARYDLVLSGFKPQISLHAQMPNYLRTSTPVIQPSGSIAFQPVFQNNASASLFVSQALLPTGGTLFLQSDLQRFDDFSSRFQLYNGIPIRLGYSQSLVGFNPFKIEKRLATHQLYTAQRQFHFEIEDAQFEAVSRYFDALIAQKNVEIADGNRLANERLLTIARERFDLGKISRDELLQMEAEYLSAVTLRTQAASQYRQALIQVSALLGETKPVERRLQMPQLLTLNISPEEVVIDMALEHAPTLLQWQMRLMQAEAEAAQLRAELAPSLQVFGSLGLAKSGDKAGEVYQRPFNEQQLQISLRVPVWDGGRRRAAQQETNSLIRNSKINHDQAQVNLISTIKQRLIELGELTARLGAQREMVAIAEQRYRISSERYVSGALPMIELFIAQRQNDQTQRDYLLSLRDLYLAYHDLRRWTGYDLATQRPIRYQ